MRSSARSYSKARCSAPWTTSTGRRSTRLAGLPTTTFLCGYATHRSSVTTDPERVLAWLQERITCRIPDRDTDPDLHRLVTRYQLHKCNAYCKRRRKCGRTFITRCRFGFPRPPCETATLNCVEDALKARKKIYQLPRTDEEARVNDYNPLLLMLWKANIDVQFVAESSLALAHYVSGYITKAEKSNLQDIWQEVSESKSVYGRLWSFGVI